MLYVIHKGEAVYVVSAGRSPLGQGKPIPVVAYHDERKAKALARKLRSTPGISNVELTRVWVDLDEEDAYAADGGFGQISLTKSVAFLGQLVGRTGDDFGCSVGRTPAEALEKHIEKLEQQARD